MRRRTVTFLAVAGAALLLAFLAWLPLDPFEEPAGPIDSCVPATVDSAWRFDGPSLLRSPFARAVWNRRETVDLRARLDVEGRVLAPLRRIEEAFAVATLGAADPPGLERDLMPAEVVVATRGDDVLVASRISSRARAIEFVRRLPERQRERIGLAADGPALVLEREGAPALRFLRHRDVLLVSTSAALLAEAAAAAGRGTGGLGDLPDASDALGIGRPAGPRILGWVRPRVAALRLAPAGDEAPPWWVAALRADDARPVRAEIRLDSPDAAEATFVLEWDRALPESLALLVRGTAEPAASLADEAARCAPADETITSGGIAVAAADVLRALLLSQPPERQGAFDEALAAAGESADGLAASFAAHFRDGAGFVVARLREADAAVGPEDAGAVRAIPATLVVLRLRGPDSGPALLAELRRRAESLFDAPLGDRAEVLADGTKLHTLERHGLAGEWELLRPAFAFRGETFVFSTHEGFLRRALAARSAGAADGAAAQPSAGGAPGASFDARAVAAPLRRWLDDQAWEHADRATWRDWAAERIRIEATIPAGLGLRPEDRTTYVDGRVREMRRVRRDREIPAVAAEWRDRWTWLDRLGEARVAADVDAAARSIAIRVRVTPREE